MVCQTGGVYRKHVRHGGRRVDLRKSLGGFMKDFGPHTSGEVVEQEISRTVLSVQAGVAHWCGTPPCMPPTLALLVRILLLMRVLKVVFRGIWLKRLTAPSLVYRRNLDGGKSPRNQPGLLRSYERLRAVSVLDRTEVLRSSERVVRKPSRPPLLVRDDGHLSPVRPVRQKYVSIGATSLTAI